MSGFSAAFWQGFTATQKAELLTDIGQSPMLQGMLDQFFSGGGSIDVSSKNAPITSGTATWQNANGTYTIYFDPGLRR
jgi:hypothetical protein